MAFVIPKEDYEPNEEEIKEHVKKFVEKGKIVKYAVPDRIEFVEEFPQTSVGKTDKKALREEYV